MGSDPLPFAGLRPDEKEEKLDSKAWAKAQHRAAKRARKEERAAKRQRKVERRLAREERRKSGAQPDQQGTEDPARTSVSLLTEINDLGPVPSNSQWSESGAIQPILNERETQGNELSGDSDENPNGHIQEFPVLVTPTLPIESSPSNPTAQLFTAFRDDNEPQEASIANAEAGPSRVTSKEVGEASTPKPQARKRKHRETAAEDVPSKSASLGPHSLLVEIPSKTKRRESRGAAVTKKGKGKEKVVDQAVSDHVERGSKGKGKGKRRLPARDDSSGGEEAEILAEHTGAVNQRGRRASKASSSGSGTSRKIPTADLIRNGPMSTEAMNDFLASKFTPVRDLRQLESEGVLTYVRGPLTERERTDVASHLEHFKFSNRIDHSDLVEILFAKGKKSERNRFPGFWFELAAILPGRPVKYVRDHVLRLYDPRGKKGQWSKEEDEDLKRAQAIHGNSWTKIAEIVDRTEQDCRDRWHKELALRDRRESGKWAPEEVDALLQAVMRVTDALSDAQRPETGSIPWQIVSDMLDNKRGPTQCRKKWSEILVSRDAHPVASRWSRQETQNLIEAIGALDVDHHLAINWNDLASELRSSRTAQSLRTRFSYLRNRITGREKMSLPELLKELKPKPQSKSSTGHTRAAAAVKVVSDPFVDSDESEPEPEAESRTPDRTDYTSDGFVPASTTPTRRAEVVVYGNNKRSKH